MRACDQFDAEQLRSAYAAGAMNLADEEAFERHLLECAECIEAVRRTQADLAALAAHQAAPAAGPSPGDRLAEIAGRAREVLDALLPDPGAIPALALRGNGDHEDEAPAAAVEGLASAGEYAPAAELLERILAATGADPSAEDCFCLGFLRWRAGQNQPALDAFESAVSAAEHHPYYRWSAAAANLAIGREAAAVLHLRATIAEQGLLVEEARELLHRLEGPGTRGEGA